MRLGIHTFTSGSLEKAAERAAELGANTFQIFSSSPRMWRQAVRGPVEVRAMRDLRERFDLRPLLVHANYLINLASCDATIRAQSIAAFRCELERASMIGAEYLVVHPGSCKGQTVEAGIAAVALALQEASKAADVGAVTVLLENTAGSGSALGSRLEELRMMRDLAGELTELSIGYCLDTCHLLAAGYDIVTPAGLKSVVKEIERALGVENVHAFHANDSKTPLGSRVDRHANIGEGYIGREAFRRILTHPKLRTKPFVLETPVDEPGDDRRNLEALKELSRRPGQYHRSWMKRRRFLQSMAWSAALRHARAAAFDIAAVERPRVLRNAAKYLNEPPVTVTASASPRSAGGKHDYFSEGDYWWPDPKNPDGPYIQRDGLSNPDNFERSPQGADPVEPDCAGAGGGVQTDEGRASTRRGALAHLAGLVR